MDLFYLFPLLALPVRLSFDRGSLTKKKKKKALPNSSTPTWGRKCRLYFALISNTKSFLSSPGEMGSKADCII